MYPDKQIPLQIHAFMMVPCLIMVGVRRLQRESDFLYLLTLAGGDLGEPLNASCPSFYFTVTSSTQQLFLGYHIWE